MRRVRTCVRGCLWGGGWEPGAGGAGGASLVAWSPEGADLLWAPERLEPWVVAGVVSLERISGVMDQQDMPVVTLGSIAHRFRSGSGVWVWDIA